MFRNLATIMAKERVSKRFVNIRKRTLTAKAISDVKRIQSNREDSVNEMKVKLETESTGVKE